MTVNSFLDMASSALSQAEGPVRNWGWELDRRVAIVSALYSPASKLPHPFILLNAPLHAAEGPETEERREQQEGPQHGHVQVPLAEAEPHAPPRRTASRPHTAGSARPGGTSAPAARRPGPD